MTAYHAAGTGPARRGVAVGIGAVFILFFVTLGPLKLLGPFAQQTAHLTPHALRAISLRVFVLGLITVLVAGCLGTFLANKWNLSVTALEITAAVILFLVAMRLVMQPYEASPGQPAPLPQAQGAAVLQLTFPLVVTPYGIAALIAVLDSVIEKRMVGAVYLILVLVMLLNLLAMLFIREIMRGPVLLVLQVFGAILGVLQVGLALQIMIRALRDLNVLAT
jgi:multiple antibiotic resistance protein